MGTPGGAPVHGHVTLSPHTRPECTGAGGGGHFRPPGALGAWVGRAWTPRAPQAQEQRSTTEEELGTADGVLFSPTRPGDGEDDADDHRRVDREVDSGARCGQAGHSAWGGNTGWAGQCTEGTKAWPGRGWAGDTAFCCLGPQAGALTLAAGVRGGGGGGTGLSTRGCRAALRATLDPQILDARHGGQRTGARCQGPRGTLKPSVLSQADQGMGSTPSLGAPAHRRSLVQTQPGTWDGSGPGLVATQQPQRVHRPHTG